MFMTFGIFWQVFSREKNRNYIKIWIRGFGLEIDHTEFFLRESGSSFEVFGGWEPFFAYFLGLGLKNLFFGWLNHMFVGIWHKICVHEGSSKKLNFTTISGISWDITGKSGHNHQCRGMPDVFWGDSWCIQNPNWDDQNSWARKNQICLIGS